jgi:hypothetical protein
VLFLSCLFESNGEEGVYFASAAGNGLDVRIWDCWFENNWNRIALGTSRHAQYECVVDGQGMGTIRPEFRSCYFSGGTTSARSIRLTTAIDYLIDHVKVFNEPANILIDGTSYGTFVNWPNQNGAYLTTVSIVKTAAATNTESRLTDVVEAAWDTWMPVVTPSGAMTLTGLNVQRARWKQIGKVVHVSIALSFTVGGTPSANLGISLPAALRFPSDDASCFSAFGSDPATDLLLPAYARLVHGTPSGFRLSRVDGRNWILGSPTRLTVNATFEIL